MSPPPGSFQGVEDGEGASTYGSWEADWLTWWIRSPAEEESLQVERDFQKHVWDFFLKALHKVKVERLATVNSNFAKV